MKYWDIEKLGYQYMCINTGIKKYWDSKILGYLNIGILKIGYWNIGIFEYWDMEILGYQKIENIEILG